MDSSVIEEPQILDQSLQNATRTRKEFSLEEELALCNLVEEKNPMLRNAKEGSRWKDVKDEMDLLNGFKREARNYRDHYFKLLKKFKSDDSKVRWSSGDVEDVTKLKLSLASLANLQRDAEIENAVEESKADSSSTCAKPTSSQALNKARLLSDNVKGREIRDLAVKVYGEKKKKKKRDEEDESEKSGNSDSSADYDDFKTSKKKKSEVDIFAALAKKFKREGKLEERKLKLEEDKLELRRKELEIRILELKAGKDLTPPLL